MEIFWEMELNSIEPNELDTIVLGLMFFISTRSCFVRSFSLVIVI